MGRTRKPNAGTHGSYGSRRDMDARSRLARRRLAETDASDRDRGGAIGGSHGSNQGADGGIRDSRRTASGADAATFGANRTFREASRPTPGSNRTLQRSLVPRLREALPDVQFVVTTHSPLVLSSFDRAELIVLDRDSEKGIRELDRQIFAFSSDQVYEWLMGMPSQSTVIEEMLEKEEDADLALSLYQSKERNEEQARAELESRQDLVERLRHATALSCGLPD